MKGSVIWLTFYRKPCERFYQTGEAVRIFFGGGGGGGNFGIFIFIDSHFARGKFIRYNPPPPVSNSDHSQLKYVLWMLILLQSFSLEFIISAHLVCHMIMSGEKNTSKLNYV